jgi:hypothetical protein
MSGVYITLPFDSSISHNKMYHPWMTLIDRKKKWSKFRIKNKKSSEVPVLTTNLHKSYIIPVNFKSLSSRNVGHLFFSIKVKYVR